MNHETVRELHRLGTLRAQLAGNNNLGTLGTRLHDETQHTVARPPDGKTSQQLIPQRLGLGNGRETTVLDALGVELDGVFRERETLLDDSRELADPPALVSENALGAGGADDDLGTGRGDADLDTRVAILGQLAGEELVELGVEDTVGDELDD